jgi:VWFA-related protein
MTWTIGIWLACAAAVWAQLPAPQAAPPRIEPSLERARRHAGEAREDGPFHVDALAYDAQGQPVAGLAAGDFSLSINGNAQKIDTCERRTGQPLRLAVIVDDLGLSQERNNAARRDLRAVVEKLAPGDEMVVLRASEGSGALDRFSSDQRALQEAISRASFNPEADSAPAETLAGTFRLAVRGALEGMRGLPGRKAVLFVSERLRDPRRRSQLATVGVARIADAAAASLYIVDMTGASDLTSLDLGLAELAKNTGGLYFNGGTVAAALAQIARDQASYYLLTFHTTNVGYDYYAAAPRVEQLSLSAAKAPGLRARNGLLGTNAEPELTTEELDISPLRAIGRELVGDALRTRVTALTAMDTRAWHVDGLVHIDGKDVTFTRGNDGRYRASVDVIASLQPDSGNSSEERIARTVDVTVSEKGVEEARAEGFSYTVTMPIVRPGSYQLAIVARDDASGRIGTARTAVTANWGPALLAMSSLLVHGEISNGPSGETLQEANEGSVLRLFRPGRRVMYQYELFNVASDAEKRSTLEVRTRVWRDGALVTEGPPIPVHFEPSETPSHRGASGSLTLTPQTRPGRYVLGVTVLDKIANRTASRYMDFEVQP